MSTKSPDSISFWSETLELADALDGARRLLYELNETPDGPGGKEGREVLAAGTSIIGMTVARLRQVALVVRGDVDPLTLLTPQNRVPRYAEEGYVDDVLLRPWSEARQAEVAESEAERLQRKQKRKQRR